MVRVRYAPSPTGTLHIGGARTALFNYLFARHTQGAFILRVEDTDRARLVPGSEERMMAGLRQLGLEWDEGPDVGGPYGPYRQSERLERYREAAAALVAAGAAYRCYCTPEELEEQRRARQAQGLPPRYPGTCRALTPEDWERRRGQPYVLRLKVPGEGQTVVDDLIRGRVVFENAVLDDFVIQKADGSPLYNFAVVLDDHDMAITHVIRGEEHLSNTPKQILVARALGFALPQYAHVPMILAPDRSKLSKRHGATAVEEYLEQGILPEALVNYLLLLGWSPVEEREIWDLGEAAAAFSLDRVQKTAAVYDYKKLEWMNGQYLRRVSVARLEEALAPFLARAGVTVEPQPPLAAVVELLRERARTLPELAEQVAYFYQAPATYDPKGVRKHFADPETAARLEGLARRLEAVEPWTRAGIEAAVDAEAAERGLARAALIHPARLAVTGRTVGPGLFELLEVLGRVATVDRLRRTAGNLDAIRSQAVAAAEGGPA
ncbi:MAG: glutamate--tRNA ligase [Firmicutes bacterium]|nr:glutamate--tRNA ligase [Bacillota bacterium]